MAGKRNRRSGKSNWPNVSRWKVYNEARSQARQVKRNAAAANVDQSHFGHVADASAKANAVLEGGFDQNPDFDVAALPCIGTGPDVEGTDLQVPVDCEFSAAQTSSGAENGTKPEVPGESMKKRRRCSFKKISQRLRLCALKNSNGYRASSIDSSEDTFDDDWSEVPRGGGLFIGGRYLSRARRVMDPDAHGNEHSNMDKVNCLKHCPPELADALEEVLQERHNMRSKSGQQKTVYEPALPGSDAAALRRACRKWLGLANFDKVEAKEYCLEPPVLEDDPDAEFR